MRRAPLLRRRVYYAALLPELRVPPYYSSRITPADRGPTTIRAGLHIGFGVYLGSALPTWHNPHVPGLQFYQPGVALAA